MKVAYTVAELKTILDKMDDSLPLPQGLEVTIGYTTPFGFVDIDSTEYKPEESFLSVDISPVVPEIDLESYNFSFIEE